MGGGQLINTSNPSVWGKCTAGFVVQNPANPKDIGLSTAQHCGTSVYWNTVATSNKINFVKSSLDRDVAWHRVPVPLVTNTLNRISVGSTNRTILGLHEPIVGEQVCLYGRTSGLRCGKVAQVGLNVSVTGADGLSRKLVNLMSITANGQLKGGTLTEQGDSGGPVFSGANAVGTTVAGSKKAGDTRTLISPSWNILTLGVFIKTSP